MPLATPPRVALALAEAAAGGRGPSGVCTATSTRPRAPRGGLCGVPCGPLTGGGPRGDGACAVGFPPWRAAAPRAGRRRWTRLPRQRPHRRSRRPRGSQGDGPHPSPCEGRALCALSTAVGAPCVAPGCRKGVQREPRGMARGGPGGGGAGALPLGGRREKKGAAPSWEPPPRSGPVSERTSSGCLLDGTVDARTSFPKPRYTP